MLRHRCVFPSAIPMLIHTTNSILNDLESSLNPRHVSSLKIIRDEGVSITNEGISLKFDVSQFKPEELSINVVDGVLVIEGKHEQMDDGKGIVSRHFIRKFRLPENLKAEDIKSELSKEGMLAIEGKCLDHEKTKVKSIPIDVK
uniref:Protein lethal(2)essential for life (inferred by orthology to a D. melanogaster protein) n=1 Tax=Strongyloides venezuelensis TaxID=75913 RepID=A0A0K0G009_STRVS